MAKYGVNKVVLVGNLGKDPELRYLEQGIAVVNFSLATTESFRRGDSGVEDRTEWHNIVMWRGLAETAAKYLRKGSTIYLEGRIVNRSWDGADGVRRYRSEVEAEKMIMLDKKQMDSFSSPTTQESSSAVKPSVESSSTASDSFSNTSIETSETDVDDLPF